MSRTSDPLPHHRLEAPAAARNRDPILTALQDLLPASGQALEIASGSGEHVLHFARAFPDWHWRPSDPDPAKLNSIAAWRMDHKGSNIDAPVALDAASPDWPLPNQSLDLVFVINMFHIAPIDAMQGFFREAARLLLPGGQVISYGPYIRDDGYASDGDRDFDKRLQQENPAWGYRSLAEVTDTAAAHGIVLQKTLAMPANNLMLVFVPAE